jgi:hypothetical protein
MDITNERNREQRQENGQRSSVDGTTMQTVALTAGSASGVIASGVARVVGEPNSATGAATQQHAASEVSGRSGDKQSQKMLAAKKRKKAAHRRKLRASHTKG